MRTLALLALLAASADPRVIRVEVPKDFTMTPDAVKELVRASRSAEDMVQRRRADAATTEELAAWIESGTDLSVGDWLARN